MSTSVSSSTSSGKSSRRRETRRALIITCSIMSVLLVIVVVFLKGSVSGTEFAPSHFQTREFSFYEVPFLHVQITPIKRKDVTGPIARQIRTKSWINVPRGKKPTQWHLVSLQRGPTGTPAIASLLTENLAIQDQNGPFWKAWNSDHPNRAAVLWPMVQRLSQRELYLMIPELLQLARSLPGKDDGKTLATAMDSWLINQYVDLIKDLRDAKRDQLADQMLAEAMADYPASSELSDLAAEKTGLKTTK